MKLITWNCCLPPWSLTRKFRLSKIVGSITLTNCDIVCLQEVFFKSDGNFIMANLKKIGFIDFFHAKDLFIASRCPLKEKQSLIFKEQGKLFTLAILDVLYQKGFQVVEFEYGNETMALVNAHLLSAKACETPGYQNVRTNQVEQICRIVDNKKCILAGDFNFPPDTLPYQKIVRSGFSDTSRAQAKTTKKKKLDYIFSKGIDIADIKSIFEEKTISDHSGLIVTF